MEVKEFKKKATNKMPAEQYDALLKKTRKEHEVMVKGMFEFLDAQGGWIDFCYRFFPGEPLKTIRLVHGEICDLPMGVVKHLNNTKKKIRKFGLDKGVSSTRGGELDLTGRGLPSTYEVQSRLRFTPMDVL